MQRLVPARLAPVEQRSNIINLGVIGQRLSCKVQFGARPVIVAMGVVRISRTIDVKLPSVRLQTGRALIRRVDQSQPLGCVVKASPVEVVVQPRQEEISLKKVRGARERLMNEPYAFQQVLLSIRIIRARSPKLSRFQIEIASNQVRGWHL